MEFNDIYDKNRNLTGRVHKRGTPWRFGEYGLVVCVWVYDGRGRILLTRRAKGKSYAGTWENSGGAAQAGENSRQAIVR
ncbi:MAG: NUDIX domain-containing protein [Oscillospiraceae bacterium]|nr:NUDIX domain-containing protein [Oscillospiraceae bacterium]